MGTANVEQKVDARFGRMKLVLSQGWQQGVREQEIKGLDASNVRYSSQANINQCCLMAASRPPLASLTTSEGLPRRLRARCGLTHVIGNHSFGFPPAGLLDLHTRRAIFGKVACGTDSRRMPADRSGMSSPATFARPRKIRAISCANRAGEDDYSVFGRPADGPKKGAFRDTGRGLPGANSGDWCHLKVNSCDKRAMSASIGYW